MKNSFVVMAFVDVIQKILCAVGGFVGIEFKRDHAVVQDVQFYAGVTHEGVLVKRIKATQLPI